MTPPSKLVQGLLQGLAQPRPARAVALLLLEYLELHPGHVLAITPSGVVQEILPSSPELCAAALVAVQNGQPRFALGASLCAVVLGRDPAVIVAASEWANEAADLAPIGEEISTAFRIALRLESLQASEAALAMAGREKEEFTSFLLHDLRNPLTVALTNLEYLRETGELTAQESVAALLDTEDSVSLVVDHLGGLLDIAQFEESRLTVRREPVAVAELLSAVVRQFEFSAGRRGVRLSCELRLPEMLPVDRDLMRRMAHNLLTTALRVTPSSGWVRVQAALLGDLLRVGVDHSGPAVPEEARPSLFTKYRRLGAGGRSDVHAHGLGLYFVRLAAEAHGGQVRAVAHPEGGGFVLELPIPP